MFSLVEAKKSFRKLSRPAKAKILKSFFKTGPGQYGEGDQFLGITVPAIRLFSRKCRHFMPAEALMFLKSPIHEERLLALLLWMYQFKKGTPAKQKEIFDLYLSHTRYINNWDLVDISAPHISGAYLADKPRKILYSLARAQSLWERRIGILSTLHFIRREDFEDTLNISELLLKDEEDLIHKAVGWLLREVGKRCVKTEESFLRKHYHKMPRTMLRYAIEKFPEAKRQLYLAGKI